jgi:A/G-specific adenine glycosylase
MATRSGPTSPDAGPGVGPTLGPPEPVLAWFERYGRDLPWRRTRDPWAVLVSETMLQQTQVARVADRWARFLQRFPTATAFAAEPVASAIEEWAGLGYNRRAVNLHRTARVIADEHGGRVPDTLPALLALPGLGPYTARAVLVFAYEHDEAVLDTNVARVAARVLGRPLGRASAQATLDSSVPPGRGWSWNQALLDVGALHCRSRRPECGGCPFAERCLWRRSGQTEPDPARGSAGVSGPQPAFAGSDRQGRGRLVDALRRGSVTETGLAEACGWPDDPLRACRIADALVADGLAERADGALRLAGR